VPSCHHEWHSARPCCRPCAAAIQARCRTAHGPRCSRLGGHQLEDGRAFAQAGVALLTRTPSRLHVAWSRPGGWRAAHPAAMNTPCHALRKTCRPEHTFCNRIACPIASFTSSAWLQSDGHATYAWSHGQAESAHSSRHHPLSACSREGSHDPCLVTSDVCWQLPLGQATWERWETGNLALEMRYLKLAEVSRDKRMPRCVLQQHE